MIRFLRIDYFLLITRRITRMLRTKGHLLISKEWQVVEAD